MQSEVRDGECAANRTTIRTNVTDISLYFLPLFAGQVSERCVICNLKTEEFRFVEIFAVLLHLRLTIVSTPCFELSDDDLESESSEFVLAFFDAE